MPELPEVEHLRRTLAGRLIGATIEAAVRGPFDVLRRDRCDDRASVESLLLVGGRVTELRRRGKHLAIIAHDDRVLEVHLGMSGRVTFGSPVPGDRHAHVAWRCRPGCVPAADPGPGRASEKRSGGAPRGTPRGTPRSDDDGWLTFRDPRRFGGLVALPSLSALDRHWEHLGPDGLESPAELLVERLRERRRQAKAALLDQAVMAGVGNIYADEALFRARVHPTQSLDQLHHERLVELVAAIQGVMQQAVDSGGSSLRDYVDADEQPGGFQTLHIVYGRAGLPCPECQRPLEGMVVAGRTTVACRSCQRLIHKRRKKAR